MNIQKEIEEKCKIAIDAIYSNPVLDAKLESDNIFSRQISMISHSEKLLTKAADECTNILNEYEDADAREFIDSGFLKDYLPKKNKDFFLGR